MINKLEKILKSVKDTAIKAVKKTVDFCRDNYKVGIMMGAGAVGGYAVEEVYGGEIKIQNVPTNKTGQISPTTMYITTSADANEAYNPNDSLWSSFPWTEGNNYLWVHSNPFNDQLQTDNRPKNTPGIEINLDIIRGESNYSADSNLWVSVTNSEGLENRKVIAYEMNDPNSKYEIPQNGAIQKFNVAHLINNEAGIYSNWRIETPALVPGDIASDMGVGILDGRVDIYDARPIFEEWLNETFEGQNYLWSDVNHDGVTDFQDFAITSKNYID